MSAGLTDKEERFLASLRWRQPLALLLSLLLIVVGVAQVNRACRQFQTEEAWGINAYRRFSPKLQRLFENEERWITQVQPQNERERSLVEKYAGLLEVVAGVILLGCRFSVWTSVFLLGCFLLLIYFERRRSMRIFNKLQGQQ